MVFNLGGKKLISGRHCSIYNKFMFLVINVVKNPLFQRTGKLATLKKE